MEGRVRTGELRVQRLKARADPAPVRTNVLSILPVLDIVKGCEA